MLSTKQLTVSKVPCESSRRPRTGGRFFLQPVTLTVNGCGGTISKLILSSFCRLSSRVFDIPSRDQ